MHILYFHQYFITPSKNGGTRSYEFAKALINKGHKVTMVCVPVSNEDLGLSGNSFVKRGIIDGIDVLQLNLSYSNYQSLFKRALVFIAYAIFSIYVVLTSKYDLVFATSTPLTAGIPGIFAKIFRHKKFVFEVRDLWPELPKAMKVVTNPVILTALSILEKLTYSCADACIALSPGMKDGIAKKCNKSKKITMIPNGCDLDLFKPNFRVNLKLEGINNSDFVGIFTGAHGKANGLHALLDVAAELLKRNRPDIKIVFIGDGKLKPSLVERATKEKLSNCLFFKPIPKKDLASIVSSADVGLMVVDNIPAFYYGTSPNKFFDYISAGLPVINNYPGWLKDLITEYKCGIAVPPENPIAFADALCYLADHPDTIKEFKLNARKLAKEEFDRNILSDKFVEFLEKSSSYE